MDKVELDQDSASMISLIYETAEDVELWPKLLEICTKDLQSQIEFDGIDRDLSSNEVELNNHVQRAIRMNLRIDEMQNKIGTTKNLLDSLPMAVITVDEKGHVENLNRLAQKIVSESKLLLLNGNKLIADKSDDTKKLLNIIAFALGRNHSGSQQRTLKLGSGKESVSVFALKTADKSERDSSALCTLFVVTNFLLDESLVPQLYDMYQLTPAEAKVALMLTSGDSLTQIADSNGISQNTVRNQLKSIFAKTNTKRQPELVSLIWSTPKIINDKDPISSDGAVIYPRVSSDVCEPKSMRLRDGRQLIYFELGDPLGRPVFYHHDIVVWDWWHLIGIENIKHLGVRLIVPCRPGFIGSTADRNVTLKSWSEDLNELAIHLDIQRFFILGHSSGGPYALAAAHFLEEKCIALSLASSMAPVAHLSDIKAIKPAMSRLLMGFAKNAPRIYRTFFNTVLKTAFANSLDYIQGYVRHWSEYDRALTMKPSVLDSISHCFNKTLKTDPFGLINESVVLVKPWGFELQDMAVTTYIWRGKDDEAVPQNLADKLMLIPDCHVNVIANGGHLIIYDHWRNIFETMINNHCPMPHRTGVQIAISDKNVPASL